MFGGEFMNKYKVTLSKKGKQINSVDDWYKYAPPMKKDIHWKDGKSAKELAKYIIEGNKYLPQELEVLLIKIGCNQVENYKENQKLLQD